jgi:hypothetical protein
MNDKKRNQAELVDAELDAIAGGLTIGIVRAPVPDDGRSLKGVPVPDDGHSIVIAPVPNDGKY